MNCPHCGAPPAQPPSPVCPMCRKRVGADERGHGVYLACPPGEAAQRVAHALAARGIAVASVSDTLVSGTVIVKNQPNILVAVLLFLLCIVPMIVYLIVSSKNEVKTFSVTIAPDGDGSRAFAAGDVPAVFVTVGQLAATTSG